MFRPFPDAAFTLLKHSAKGSKRWLKIQIVGWSTHDRDCLKESLNGGMDGRQNG